MKLRVRNNSIRLRLSQREVALFAETGIVEEKIEFGLSKAESFVYALAAGDVETINAHFASGKITVFVPEMQARNWANSNQTGMENIQKIGAEKTLKILIEKDFACVERRDGEDDSDAFPPPKEKDGC